MEPYMEGEHPASFDIVASSDHVVPEDLLVAASCLLEKEASSFLGVEAFNNLLALIVA